MATDGALPEYSEKAAARILGVNARTLRRWRERGLIAFHRMPGNRVRYSMADLLDIGSATRVTKSTSAA